MGSLKELAKGFVLATGLLVLLLEFQPLLKVLEVLVVVLRLGLLLFGFKLDSEVLDCCCCCCC